MSRRRFPFPRRKKAAKKPKGNYAFIDSQNLNLGTQKMGWKLDWKKFRQFLQDEYNVQKAYMFIGYVPDNEDLYKQMKDAGYAVVLKPTVDMLMSKEELADDSHVTKGNADAELVLYAMKELPYYEKAVVVSGDGDFYCIVEYLVGIGKFEKMLTPNMHYSSLLERFEQHLDSVDNYRKKLVYEYIKKKKYTKKRSEPKKQQGTQQSQRKKQSKNPQKQSSKKPQK